ncbi:MAG: hypothetical protein DME52_02630 [Verrucomicrobia bacterium]|nr:MAG: hypothetical protein DME52_02630 [Verrucomicrobiota bacterium]
MFILFNPEHKDEFRRRSRRCVILVIRGPSAILTKLEESDCALKLPALIVSAVAMTALAGGSLLSQTMQPPRLDISPDKRISGRSVVKSVHIRGNPEAAVTLEEFGDFECPSCARLATFLDDLIKEYHPRARLIFRNFPLAMHQIGAFLSNKKQGSAGR